MLNVRPVNGEHLRYYVDSETKEDETHIVDLEGRGKCDCGHFLYRVWPAWRRNEDYAPCKHLVVARYYHSMEITHKSRAKAEAQADDYK